MLRPNSIPCRQWAREPSRHTKETLPKTKKGTRAPHNPNHARNRLVDLIGQIEHAKNKRSRPELKFDALRRALARGHGTRRTASKRASLQTSADLGGAYSRLNELLPNSANAHGRHAHAKFFSRLFACNTDQTNELVTIGLEFRSDGFDDRPCRQRQLTCIGLEKDAMGKIDVDELGDRLWRYLPARRSAKRSRRLVRSDGRRYFRRQGRRQLLRTWLRRGAGGNDKCDGCQETAENPRLEPHVTNPRAAGRRTSR
jgi:hypothetical protein